MVQYWVQLNSLALKPGVGGALNIFLGQSLCVKVDWNSAVCWYPELIRTALWVLRKTS